MTRARGPAEAGRHVIIIGVGTASQAAATALAATGITDVSIHDNAPGHEVISAVFDDNTDTWSLRSADGDVFHSRVVIAARRGPHVPWIPQLAGRDDFGGVSFHAAEWDPHFDPTDQRIAVVGPDANASHHMPRLAESAASVTVFAHSPRRIVGELPSPITRANRWRRRRVGLATNGGRSRRAPALVRSPVATVTPSGIRTRDGVDHRADAIIYGTGFTIPGSISDETLIGARGVTIRQAWADGMEPYFGVAVHGFPNYFFLTGPDTDSRARYVAECVGLMHRNASTRMEVRRSTQQVFNERVCVQPAPPHPVSVAFDVSSGGADDHETYDGAATLTIAGAAHPVRVRLTGRLDPIDGRYHWQGTVFSSPSRPLPDEVCRARAAMLTVGERSAPARIVEQTPWGTHSVAGVGTPPYALS